jgi:hypothetical protein
MESYGRLSSRYFSRPFAEQWQIQVPSRLQRNMRVKTAAIVLPGKEDGGRRPQAVLVRRLLGLRLPIVHNESVQQEDIEHCSC